VPQQKLCEHQFPEVEDFDFPPKVWFNTFSEQLIEFRRQRFEAYLSLLVRGSWPCSRSPLPRPPDAPNSADPPAHLA
jgi:hypothetical protein